MKSAKLKSPGRPKNKPGSKPKLSDDLRDQLERIRFPNGFVCPHCGWRHTGEWAREKAERIRRRYRGPRPGLSPASLRQTWYLKDGKIKCQQCRRHVSLTVGTPLEGVRTPLVAVIKTAGIFLENRDGIGTAALAAQAGVSPECARNLTGIFRTAMALAPEERLEGTVQVGEFELRLHPAKSKHPVSATVAIAVEDVHGKPGRIAAAVVDKQDPDPWVVYLDMVKPGSIIETRLPDAKIDGLRYNGYRVACITAHVDPEASPLCADMFARLETVFRRIYRGALSPGNLQGYLDEYAFRWNRIPRGLGADPRPASQVLIRKLLQPPPPARSSHEAERERYRREDAIV